MTNRLAGLVPASLKQSLPYRAVRSAYLFRDTNAYRHLRERVRGGQEKRVAGYLATHDAPRLHIGCGANPLDGWLNTDYFPDDPANSSDPILQLVPVDRRSTLIAQAGSEPGILHWDIVMRDQQATPKRETVFFAW